MKRISSFALSQSSPAGELPLTRRAFTLIELLAVMAVIAILAGLLLPALSSGKGKAQTILCLNNKKQLQLAWLLYAGDYEDRLVLQGQPLPKSPRSDLQYWWAQGTMDFEPDRSDNTNAALLVNPRYALMGDYADNALLFRCPADKSVARFGATDHPRVRSVSLNAYLGQIVDCFGFDPTPVRPSKLAQVQKPAENYAFIDEHPDSIRGVSFWLGRGQGPDAKLVSYPSPLHHGGATLSFVDGHAESYRWKDERTRPKVRYDNSLAEAYSPNNPDLVWLQARIEFPSPPEE